MPVMAYMKGDGKRVRLMPITGSIPWTGNGLYILDADALGDEPGRCISVPSSSYMTWKTFLYSMGSGVGVGLGLHLLVMLPLI